MVLLSVALLAGACATEEQPTANGSAPTADVTTSTTEPETEGSAPLPGEIEGLSWNLTEPRRVGGLSWVGSQWMVSNTADSGILSTVDAMADRESWELLELPEGFLPADARGRGASMVSWGETGAFTSAYRGAVAVSNDAGASWDLLATDFEALGPPPTEYFSVWYPILGATVRDNVVLVAVAPQSIFDRDAAVAAAGIPAQLVVDPDDAPLTRTSEPVWGHNDSSDDFVDITDMSFTVGTQTQRVSFDQLGVDRGAHRPRLPIRLLRSIDGGPLQDVTLDLDLGFDVVKESVFAQDASTTPGSTLELGVVNDGFYIVRQQGDSAEVLSSPDGLTWQTHDFEGSANTIAATNDALFALRDAALIRSDDIGRTWIVVPTARRVSQLAAGPSGVLLNTDSPDSSIAWSTIGRDFDWVPLRDTVPFEVDDSVDESVTLAEAVIGDGQIMVSIDRVRPSASGERRAIQSPDYVLEVD